MNARQAYSVLAAVAIFLGAARWAAAQSSPAAADCRPAITFNTLVANVGIAPALPSSRPWSAGRDLRMASGTRAQPVRTDRRTGLRRPGAPLDARHLRPRVLRRGHAVPARAVHGRLDEERRSIPNRPGRGTSSTARGASSSTSPPVTEDSSAPWAWFNQLDPHAAATIATAVARLSAGNTSSG